MMIKIFFFFEKRPWLTWSLTVIYMAIIFYFSSLSYFPPGPLTVAVSDLVKHAVLYFGLAILLFLSFNTIKNKNVKKKAWVLALLATILYGISDELHQLFVPNRVCSFSDVMANSIGAYLGAGIMDILHNKFKWKKP